MLEKIKKIINKRIANNSISLKKSSFMAFGLGALLVLAFAPFNLFFFAIISLSLFYAMIEQKNCPKQISILAFFYMFGFFVFGVYWICNSLFIDLKRFGWLIPFAITLIPALMAIYFAIIIYLYHKLTTRYAINLTYQKIIFFSVSFLIFEVIRSNLFTGFSWNLLGYIWLFDIRMSQLASIIGVYGLSFFACATCLLPYSLIYHQGKIFNKIFSVIILFLLIANYFFGYFYIDQNYQQNNLPIANLRLVQANIAQKDKWQEEEKYRIIADHLDLTISKPLDKIDAVIWSETSMPFVIEKNDTRLHNIIKNAIPPNGNLVSGGISFERGKIFNSMLIFDNNSLIKTYDKRHLVPFGEFVPLHRYLGFLFIDQIVDQITGGGVGFSEGEGEKMIKLSKFSFNPLLCYEVIFSDEMLDKNSSLPDMFINLTNDAWFGVSTGPFQHLQMARMRAIEYGRPLIRVAQSGISAHINHYGEVIDKISLNKRAIMDISVYKNNNRTFYSQNYHLILWIILFWSAILIFIKNIHELTKKFLKKFK
jgi:apolipoprotein N-acyltransferase